MAEPVRFTPESTQGVVWMSPQQYLDLSPSMKDPEAGPQAKALRDSLARGEPINAPSSLTVEDGKVTKQDGRHRALEAQKAGIRMIPVKIEGALPEDGNLVGMMGKPVALDAKALTPKPWTAVSKSETYRKLSDDAKERAKRQYFEQVIAPRVSKQDLDSAARQWQGVTDARVPPTQIDPTEGMSGFERFRAGTGKAFRDIGLGVRSILPESIGGTKPGEVEEARRLDAPLMETTAGRLGNLSGNVAIAAPTALLPGANTVAGAGLYGAAFGGLQPASSMSERAGNALEGGMLSGGITGGVRAVPSIYKALIDPLTSAGQNRLALDTINRFAKDPNAMSRMGPSELIPGSKGTLAEVTGDPGIAQLQRAAQAASNETASAMAELKTARMQARKDALLKIAGDSGEKEFFEAARSATAGRLYGEAYAAGIEPAVAKRMQPQVKWLLQRPSIQDAQAGAIRMAKEEGEKLTAADIKSGSVKGLHYVKRELDSQIDKAKAAGDMNMVRLLGGTKEKLLTTIDELSPAYKNARAEYAAASKPINRMEIGQYMYDKLIPALSDLGAERITPQKFAEALKQGDQMAQRATGFKGAKLDDVLTGPERDTLVKLGLDIGRETKAMEQARVPGSPTAQYLAGRNMLRQVAGPLGMPEGWAESVLADTLSNRWVSLAAKPLESRIQSRLSEMLTDPNRARAAAAANVPSVPMSVLNTAARRGLPPAAIGMGSSSGQ